MTAQEKTVLARFLAKAMGYLNSGYEKEREIVFEDDPLLSEAPAPGQISPADFPSLPLAYLIDEEETGGEDSGEGSLEDLAAEINACAVCSLGKTRTKAVPGEGAPEPLVMIIGEGPGADEDASGRPFVGKAGQLLDRMLASVGLSREKNCYIANIVKCRPPNNRDPDPEETRLCAPFLERQIRLLKPRLILCAGRVAAQHILRSGEGINRLRRRFGEYQVSFPGAADDEDNGLSIPVLPTFHPSALLREESLKRPAFEDMKLLMARLAGLDPDYAGEVKELLQKYAAADEEFAARIREYLV